MRESRKSGSAEGYGEKSPYLLDRNNGFSSDELYVATLLNVIKMRLAGAENVEEYNRPEEKEAVISAERILKSKLLIRDPRVERILLKLAIGHIAYELSELMIDNWNGNLEIIDYFLKPQISENDWDNLSAPVILEEGILPEVGARSYRNIYIAESLGGSGRFVIIDWNEVQPGSYKYIAYYDNGKMIVKMIIKDTIYSRIELSNNT